MSRQEELSLRPKIILIYDFISDNETNVLLKYADKDWQVQNAIDLSYHVYMSDLKFIYNSDIMVRSLKRSKTIQNVKVCRILYDFELWTLVSDPSQIGKESVTLVLYICA